MSKTILLLSDYPDDASFLTHVCAATGAKLQLAANVADTIEFLAAEPCSAIFLDVTKTKNLNAFEIEAQKRFGLFADQIQHQKFHFISEVPLHENRDVIKSPFFGSFYERPKEDIEENGKYYGRFVQASEQMMTHNLKHFLGDAARVQTVTLTHTDQKGEAAEAVRQYLIKAKVPVRISNLISNTVDELLMNAIFDAPVDDLGKQKYSHASRNESRALTGAEQVTMALGFDGFRFGVSVTDRFGSLDQSKLLNHISLNPKNREYTPQAGQAGAGLGIASINSSGGSLIYHCEAGVKTEVNLLCRVYPGFKEFREQFRFFSAKYYV